MADLTLDIIVRPDRSWYWKDEDELQLAVSKGACSEDYAKQIRAAGEEVVHLIESAESPFNDEWSSWVPPPNAKIVDTPDGWQHAPVWYPQG
jgi:predicted RNA-binding protein associated with RNAse of E/G family